MLTFPDTSGGKAELVELIRLRSLILRVGVVCIVMVAGCGRSETGQPVENLVEEVDAQGPTAATAIVTAIVSATPIYPGVYTGTPTPNPTTAASYAATKSESYVVQSGETLSQIAAVFGCTVEEIVAANELADADSIGAGQTLHIPSGAAKTGPYLKLIPDSELVYGPAYVQFELADFVAGQGGYLAGYAEEVDGELLTGAEIIQLVSERLSVGPRVLLSLLELQAGWVTQQNPAADTLVYPIGHFQSYYEGLFQQLEWAAVRLNQGYYGWKRGDRTTVRLTNGTRAAIAPGLNPGTAGVQHCLAELSSTWDEWIRLTGSEGFQAAYEGLFGNPFAYTVDPLVPPDLMQPELRLPWDTGLTWYFVGGPHGGWGDGNDRAALDFVPSEELPDCTYSNEWATAAAPGLVVRSENGEVLLDLDGDGFEQTGWVLFYMHVRADGRAERGTYVERGQSIGHPSCEGGYAPATHLHFARRYNGEWVPAGSGPVPMVLSGWVAHEDVMPYDGTLTRGGEVREALEFVWRDDANGLVSDNAP